jgi:lysophospholipase L1-like esterase
MKKRRGLLVAKTVFIVVFMLLNNIKPGQLVSAGQPKFICADEIKVMPLGDSITTGKYSGNDISPGADADDIGYRKDLWNLLTTSGFDVNFVGTQSNGNVPSSPFSDPDHEGHNGYTDTQIADNIYNEDGGDNWLIQNPPDVILLHIGTNELSNNSDEVERILDEIDEYETDAGSRVIVILARIIDMVPNNPVVNQFNNKVEEMATGRSEFGVDLFIVDMEDGAGINYSIWSEENLGGDMIDGLHPYATGHTKMAAVWMAEFDNLCQKIYLPILLRSYAAKTYFWE